MADASEPVEPVVANDHEIHNSNVSPAMAQKLRNRLRQFVIFQIVLTIITIALAILGWKYYSALTTYIADLRLEQARLQANVPIANMALADNSQVIADFADTTKICDARIFRTLPEEMQTKLLNACSPVGAGVDQWAATRAFLDKYNAALTARLSAKTPNDFRKVAALYEAAVKVATKTDVSSHTAVDRDWLMRALEGDAYALMRTGEYPKAISQAQAAKTLAQRDFSYPVFLFANLTEIKAQCLMRYPAAEVRAEYGTLLKSLGTLVKQYSTSKKFHAIAKSDREAAEQDLELFELCDYVHLSPS
jgi:hypothetical protein